MVYHKGEGAGRGLRERLPQRRDVEDGRPEGQGCRHKAKADDIDDTTNDTTTTTTTTEGCRHRLRRSPGRTPPTSR